MAISVTLNSASPADVDTPQQGAGKIRGVIGNLEALFTIPDGVTITSPILGTVAADGTVAKPLVVKATASGTTTPVIGMRIFGQEDSGRDVIWAEATGSLFLMTNSTGQTSPVWNTIASLNLANGNFTWISAGSSANTGTLQHTNTAERLYTFPDRAITVGDVASAALTAAGDLYYATAASTVGVLAPGALNAVLTVVTTAGTGIVGWRSVPAPVLFATSSPGRTFTYNIPGSTFTTTGAAALHAIGVAVAPVANLLVQYGSVTLTPLNNITITTTAGRAFELFVYLNGLAGGGVNFLARVNGDTDFSPQSFVVAGSTTAIMASSNALVVTLTTGGAAFTGVALTKVN